MLWISVSEFEREADEILEQHLQARGDALQLGRAMTLHEFVNQTRIMNANVTAECFGILSAPEGGFPDMPELKAESQLFAEYQAQMLSMYSVVRRDLGGLCANAKTQKAVRIVAEFAKDFSEEVAKGAIHEHAPIRYFAVFVALTLLSVATMAKRQQLLLTAPP